MPEDGREGIAEIGVSEVADRLRLTLRRYIEAQYHIRNEALIAERLALLNRPETINQRPYIETTPTYAHGRGYEDMAIPLPAARILRDLAALGIGIFERPYQHQEEALEAFIGRGEDIVIATGTGSGKTESFLMPIIADLAIAGTERIQAANAPGCRALLLYPMNALVNDQLSRIRRLFGDERAAELLRGQKDRPVTFATYTGRTPYPGRRNPTRDSQYIKPLFEEYYLPLLHDKPEIVSALRARGKWPAKDLLAFYDAERVVVRPQKTGKKKGQPRPAYNWRERLKTGQHDRELMTRAEVQERCPDILITNYSMLEYMLMRPIERSIFGSTREWLRAFPGEKFTLVVDEAHLYYGAAGEEVALLIRRLTARLGITRDRLRCIVTSASLGDSGTSADAEAFAAKLTGLSVNSGTKFTVINGKEEAREHAVPADSAFCSALSNVNLFAIERFSTDLPAAVSEVRQLAASAGWDVMASAPAVGSFRDYLFNQLHSLGPVQLLSKLTSGKAIGLSELASAIFPSDGDGASDPISALLTLCTIARRAADGRVLLPTRLHLFFRGLPGLHACIDPTCSARLAPTKGGALGRLYTEARTQCVCESRARVYELRTHRDCGSAFIAAYIAGYDGRFLWNERAPTLGTDRVAPISPIEFLVDGEPHQNQVNQCRPAWLDKSTGRVEWREPTDRDGFRKIFASADVAAGEQKGFVFRACPICQRSWNSDSSKIMDHQTKGEEPFAALIAEQLRAQPPLMLATPRTPNAGRKVLLFSDGRQKAARLARDIPRSVDKDVFREAMAVAVSRINGLGREARPTNELYVAFLSVLASNNLLFFDRHDRRQLANDTTLYARDYENDLTTALYDFSSAVTAPQAYNHHLLRQLCSEFYSLSEATVGFVSPTQDQRRKLETDFKDLECDPSDAMPLAVAWITSGLTKFAFDSRLEPAVRRRALGYNRGDWSTDGRFERSFRDALGIRFAMPENRILNFEKQLALRLGQPAVGDGLYVDPRKVAVVIDLEKAWIQCSECTRLSAVSFRNACLHCGSGDIEVLTPGDSTYIAARKGYWRAPVARAIAGARLEGVTVEEHTAQLSHRDRAAVYATTERYELRFQDMLIDDERPIDVLSCTTTMEVGIDIGSLLAVGLRNVPPQRSNYQQRAGRAGRRGAGVSTVVTYAQNGPHDSYFFHSPEKIIAGTAVSPRLKLDNAKIATRHVHSFLFQTFFNEAIDGGRLVLNGDTSELFKALGRTDEFFHSSSPGRIGLEAFADWIGDNLARDRGTLTDAIASWLPDAVCGRQEEKTVWIRRTAAALLKTLADMRKIVPKPSPRDGLGATEQDDEQSLEQDDYQTKEWLLDFLFDENLLPSYAFPTHLAGFMIEEYVQRGEFQDVRVAELPQQSLEKALSEYAPGRLVVINKETYRSAGVAAAVLPRVEDRAAPLFRDKHVLSYCSACTYVAEVHQSAKCPICGSLLVAQATIEPQVFHPERGKALDDDDREQEITYATMAQFPVPFGEELNDLTPLGPHTKYGHTVDRRLISVNRGVSRQLGGHSGFLVCTKCGLATLDDEAPSPHDRPYLRPRRFGSGTARCKGSFERVYLGSIFRTDLVLLRFELDGAIISNTNDPLERHIIEDVLYTVSEALSIAAGLHPELDIDPRELGSGFRIIPDVAGREKYVDVYLYDTSSGGAGYSEVAARYMGDIVRNAVKLLEGCPNRCERSCQQCLRHYYNQHFQDRLDRTLGAQFLRYATEGIIPKVDSKPAQAEKLARLARMLQLEGWECTLSASGARAPLIVKGAGVVVAVGVAPGLVRASAAKEPWETEACGAGMIALTLNDYMLARNLPDSQRLVSALLR